MNNSELKLVERLSTIWQKPDFKTFFEKYSKKKSVLIKKNTIIFNDGQLLDNIYYIKTGFVKLYRLSENGRESTIYLYGPGQILGIRALTSEDESAKHYAESITDLKIVTLSRKEYLEIVKENPQYLIDLLHVFIDRLNYTERKLEGFILTDNTARVASFLLDCMTRFCKNGDKVLPIPLTHQRIAEFVGSFRETVTVSLNKLEKEKVLKMEKGKVTILDTKKLKQYVNKQ